MIKNNIRLILVTLVLFLSACSDSDTLVLTPSSTPEPTSTPFPTPTATPDFDSLLEPGWEAISSENYELAESLADTVLEVNNKHGNAWLLKGLAKSYRGDYRDAILELKQAKVLGAENVDLAIENNYSGLFNEVMDLLNNTWDVNKALDYINEIQALFIILNDINPDNSLIQEFGPVFLYSQEDFIYIDDSNDDLIEHFSIAEDYFSRGNYSYAIEEFKKAIEVAPDFAFAYLYLGDSYYFIEDYVNSEYYMKKAVEIDPLLSDAWAFLGDTYRKLELPQHSKEAYTRALLINSENNTAILGFGKLKPREPWKTDYFNDFGFLINSPQPTDENLEKNGGYGNMRLNFGDWLVYVYWSPTLSTIESKYEENVEKNLYIINNVFSKNENVIFEILDNMAYEFLYSVTEFAVQPYQYTPLDDDHHTNAAIVSGKCGHHEIVFDFQFGFEIEYGLNYYLSPMVESFRCDLEDHSWFPIK